MLLHLKGRPITEEKRFPCDECHFLSISEKGVRTHKKLRHGACLVIPSNTSPKKLKTWACQYCDTILKAKRNLDYHLFVKHKEETAENSTFTDHLKRHACDVCDFFSHGKKAMKAHIVSSFKLICFDSEPLFINVF